SRLMQTRSNATPSRVTAAIARRAAAASGNPSALMPASVSMAPSIENSPWARLMMPLTLNTTAKPIPTSPYRRPVPRPATETRQRYCSCVTTTRRSLLLEHELAVLELDEDVALGTAPVVIGGLHGHRAHRAHVLRHLLQPVPHRGGIGAGGRVGLQHHVRGVPSRGG